MAVPLISRRQLIGFTLYSGHRGGEAIDPDEQVALVHLSEAAASAYEQIATIVLTDEANELRRKNEILEHEQRLLREMVDTLRERPSQKALG